MNSFYSWVIFHCVYVPQLAYPFICRWTFRLLSYPSSCKTFVTDFLKIYYTCAYLKPKIIRKENRYIFLKLAYIWRPTFCISFQLGNVLCVSAHGFITWGFADGSDGKESACNAGHLGLNIGLGKSPRGRHGDPLQYSCLENSMDGGAWQIIVHGVAWHELDMTRVMSMGFSRQNTGVACYALFQGILWTQDLNWGLLHYIDRFFTIWATMEA